MRNSTKEVLDWKKGLTSVEDFSIKKRAELLANLLVMSAINDAALLKKELEEQGASVQEIPIMLEFVAMYYHLTDRAAFGELDEEKREDFITLLFTSTTEEVFTKATYSNLDTFRSGFTSFINSRMIAYGVLDGNRLFGAMLDEIKEKYRSDETIYQTPLLLQLQFLCMETMKFLNIKQLLSL
jgi:hypothetical protein